MTISIQKPFPFDFPLSNFLILFFFLKYFHSISVLLSFQFALLFPLYFYVNGINFFLVYFFLIGEENDYRTSAMLDLKKKLFFFSY